MKKVIIVLIIVLILLMLAGFAVLQIQKKSSVSPSVIPTPVTSDLPIPVVSNPDEVNPTTVARLQEEQTKADYDYGIKQQQRYTDYPWHDSLPLQTDNYFIYFDTDELKFFGQIYNKENEEATKEEILTRLRELGITVENYEIIWQ